MERQRWRIVAVGMNESATILVFSSSIFLIASKPDTRDKKMALDFVRSTVSGVWQKLRVIKLHFAGLRYLLSRMSLVKKSRLPRENCLRTPLAVIGQK